MNYIHQKNIEMQIITQPDGIPTSQVAQITSFWFMNVMADIYWLKTIQYIWENVLNGEYKKYIAIMINLITDMNPYFEAPYIIGQLVIPTSSGSYDDTTDSANFKDYQDAKNLWLKWVSNFCDSDKLALIQEENNLAEIINNEKYSNPCKSYKIPYYLAFIYYFYLKENTNAANYYKVVAAQKDAPKWARMLAAIMQWKWGEREKSLSMFLSLAENTSSQWEACSMLTEEIKWAYNYISKEKLEITGAFIEDIQNASIKYLPQLSENNEKQALEDAGCTNFLAKSIREINLMYLENADIKYINDNPSEVSAMTPEKLLENWYITFIPTDYQQYEDENYGIVYRYSSAIGRFDYEMWTILK